MDWSSGFHRDNGLLSEKVTCLLADGDVLLRGESERERGGSEPRQLSCGLNAGLHVTTQDKAKGSTQNRSNISEKSAALSRTRTHDIQLT